MSQESESVLKKSLDAVDRHKQRAMLTVAITMLPLLWAFYTFIDASRTGDLRKMITGAVVILAFWTANCLFVVVLQLTVATKRILRAIELASKPS